jgi:hypothetical protein
MRVLPSSFTVLRNGPTTAFAVSTTAGRGHKPNTISPIKTNPPAYGSQWRLRARAGRRGVDDLATAVSISAGHYTVLI